MSKIKTGTTLTTAYQVEGDTTGTLVIQTGSTPTTAVTVAADQNVTVAGNVTLNNGTADGAQLTLASSGYSDWNWDNYSGRLRAYYGSTEYFTINSSGNVGIGTNSPSSKLTLADGQITVANSGASNPAINFKGNGSGASGFQLGQNYNAQTLYVYDNAASAQRLTIDSSGNVGIGTSSPSTWISKVAVYDGALSVAAGSGSNFPIKIYSNGQTNNQVELAQGFALSTDNIGYLYNRANAAFVFGTNNTERMRIDSSGNLLVGTTSAFVASSHNIQNANSASYVMGLRNANATAGKYWIQGPNSGNSYVLYNPSNVGVYIADGATTWSANSDERLKTALTPFENAAAKVATLRAGTGRYLTDDESVRRSFLIAQDVQAVLPEAVNVQDDEIGTLGLQYTDLIPLLTAAIQEQQALINAQQAALTSLTERISALENK